MPRYINNIVLKPSSHYALLPAVLNTYHPEKSLKINHGIKEAGIENMEFFSVMKRNPSYATTKSKLFCVSKDE